MPRNPPWTTDELVLALALYFEHGWLDDTNPLVVELSGILNALPHTAADPSTYRNPNGVGMKLANFLAIDPNHLGAGLTRFGRRDQEVWDAWTDRRDECRALAAAIRAGVATATLPAVLEEDEGRPEGGIVMTAHRRRERSSAVTRRRKQQVRDANDGQLICEACGLTERDVRSNYGNTVGDVFECHHLVPLAAVLGARNTKPEDLAVLCPTCHRAIHRIVPMPTVAALHRRLSAV
jgi:5-methylcytosine-specific restriction protein A